MKTKIYCDNLPPLPLYPSTIALNFRQTGISRPVGYHYDEIFIVKSGSGILHIDGETFTLYKNDMFYLHANTPHEYYPLEGCLETDFLSFFGNSKGCIREYYSLGNYGIYKNKSSGSFAAEFLKLFENFDSTHELSTLSAMTYSAVTAFFDAAYKKEYTPIEKVYNYLEANYSKPVTLDNLLFFYPYSKTKLCTDFKRFYGRSIFDVLTEIRINHAREILSHNPHIALKNIAEASGFGDVSYFCKVYKRLLGTTPKSSYPREAEL